MSADSHKIWRAALYLRLSKEDGDGAESESITNQRALLITYAQKLPDVMVAAEKVDDGWSGATFQRPAFIEMMEEIRAGAIDCVIVKDLTRFGRNFGQSGKYIEHIFPFLGVRFISVNDGIDSQRKKGRSDDIVVPFLNLISDAYCRDISVKIRSQLDVKRKKGDFVGAFPVFGYTRDGRDHNRLVIDEPAARVVKLIFRWKLDGQSARAVADRLDALGIPPPMEYKRAQGVNYSTPFARPDGAKWSHVAVLRILNDEMYTGVMVQGKSGTPNHKIKKKLRKPASDWARVAGAHEPIISADDFRLTARLLERDTRTAPGGGTVYPFSGMAKCGLCGENMIRKTSRSNGKSYVYFVCCRRCRGARIPEGVLAECVRAALHSHIGGIMDLGRIRRFIGGLPVKQDEAQTLNRQIAAKRAEIERCDMLLHSLRDSLQNGIIDEADHRRLHAHYFARRGDAERAIGGLRREISCITDRAGEKSRLIRQYPDLAEPSRRILVSLVDVVTVYPGARLDISLRYRYDYKGA